MNTVKLLLSCPECGNTNWIHRDDKDGAFECAACNEFVMPEDMMTKTSEENNNSSTTFDLDA